MCMVIGQREEINMEKLYKIAVNTWKELNKKVEKFNGSLEELYDKLGGHCFEDDLFDVNYGLICTTIIKKDEKIELVDNLELWDENANYIGYFDVNWLEERVNKREEN